MEDSVTPDNGQSAKSRDDNVEREQVHFYPGDDLLLYVVDGKVQLRADAMGGPPVREPDKPIDYEPTHAGVFVIDAIAPYATKTWPRSKIPWGTPIRESRKRAGGIEYQAPSGMWRPLVVEDEKGFEMTASGLIGRYERWHHLTIGFPKTWFLNDFGPKAIRYYRDVNRNHKRDPNEPFEGEMLHTTPKNEAQSEENEEVVLEQSHGCIHVKPVDRDKFIDAGAFRKGMTLVIHRYDEEFKADGGGRRSE